MGRYKHGGDEAALSASAIRGAELFQSEKVQCAQCHVGFQLTHAVWTDGNAPIEAGFQDIGLYNVREGAGAGPNTG